MYPPDPTMSISPCSHLVQNITPGCFSQCGFFQNGLPGHGKTKPSIIKLWFRFPNNVFRKRCCPEQIVFLLFHHIVGIFSRDLKKEKKKKCRCLEEMNCFPLSLCGCKSKRAISRMPKKLSSSPYSVYSSPLIIFLSITRFAP